MKPNLKWSPPVIVS
jgi:hypothetical protein